jgi:hypothetical protein
VGLLHRVIEDRTGIPGVSLTAIRGTAEAVKPPRAVFLPFPSGATFGKPGNRPLQKRILMEALTFLASNPEPGAILDSGIRFE